MKEQVRVGGMPRMSGLGGILAAALLSGMLAACGGGGGGDGTPTGSNSAGAADTAGNTGSTGGNAATFSYRFESMRTSADAFVTFADRLGRDGFGFLMPTTMGHLYFKPSSCTGENCAVMYSLTQS